MTKVKKSFFAKRIISLILSAALAMLISGCEGQSQKPQEQPSPTNPVAAPAYEKLTPEQAKEVMDSDEPYILLDVRTEEEFIEQRIPGAKLIPDTEIASRAASELADKNAFILVYCRSGRRSADVAKELVAMGYTRVYDFGGIIDWPYETESGGQAQPSNASDPLANPVQGEVIIRFDYEKQQATPVTSLPSG
jgi:rhodanese-related sulfurtransferase